MAKGSQLNKKPSEVYEQLRAEGYNIPDKLARPSKGRNLTTAQKIKIATCVCDVYSGNKYTINSILGFFGIMSRATWSEWQKQIQQIEQLYKEASKIKDELYFAALVPLARTSLQKRVEGEVIVLKSVKVRRPTLKEEKEYEIMSIELESMVEETTKQVYIQPSDAAIMYVLDNKDSTNFSRVSMPKQIGDQENAEYDDWTNEQINEELERLEKKESQVKKGKT